MEGYDLRESRTWQAGDDVADTHVFLHLSGVAPLPALLAYVAACGKDPTDVKVHFGYLSWVAPATEEEIAARRASHKAADECHERWERKMWEKLRPKFGDEAAE